VKPHVLIVEDDLDARTVLCDLLEHEGYDVQTAKDGQAALDLLRKGVRPCLMLVDRQMDRMGGDQLVREIAASPFAGIAVVVLTAHPGRARDLGVRAVLQKPVDSQALLGVIEQFCSHRRSKPSPKQRGKA
jgi:CheY-like chemotaxis protein